jgi:predicted 3-demethylubiquinone-9 3-methyltransferase (glyoxalase superfamily)
LEAARFHTGIFGNAKIGKITRHGEGGPRPKGSVLSVGFRLVGEEFLALNGEPPFKFTEGVSFIVNCATQKEVVRIWKTLSHGGSEVLCGRLKAKYGMSWQIVQTVLGQILSIPDSGRAPKVNQLIMRTKKLDIRELKEALGRREGGSSDPSPLNLLRDSFPFSLGGPRRGILPGFHRVVAGSGT